MNTENKSLNVLLPVGVVWLLSLFSGLPTVPAAKPLTSSPPPGAGAPAVPGVPPGAAARLWDDPLEATGALNYIPFKAPIDVAQSGGTAKPAEVRISPPREPIGLALFVLLRGSQYAELAEVRRRQRQALQAAMTSAGYTPLQAETLSFTDFSFDELWPGKTSEYRHGESCQMRVPWEDYRHGGGSKGDFKPDRVRVFYLNLNLLDHHPVSRMHCLIAALQARKILGSGHVRLATTSPPTTDWLKAMLNDTAEATLGSHVASSVLHIYNSTATGKIAELASSGKNHPTLDIIPGTEGPARSLSFENAADQSGSRLKVVLHAMIEDDDAAATRLFLEFGKRGLYWGSGPRDPAVAVIAESESTFARDIARKLDLNLAVNLNSQRTENHRRESAHPVQVFSYLRGVDGLAPGNRQGLSAPDYQTPAQRAAAAGNPGEVLSRALDPSPMPRPFGPAQYDYCARLGQQLERWQSWRRDQGLGRVQAIGVIGTEMDDKLALLKVLRPRFPNTLFFTNNVDADYLQPENSPYTRNLLIFTRYDLEGEVLRTTNQARQVNLPPFRSNLQTALVDSVWAALRLDEAPPQRAVRLYETGLRHLHELAMSLPPGDSAARADDQQEAKPKVPELAWGPKELKRSWRHGWNLLLSKFGGVFLFALVAILAVAGERGALTALWNRVCPWRTGESGPAAAEQMSVSRWVAGKGHAAGAWLLGFALGLPRPGEAGRSSDTRPHFDREALEKIGEPGAEPLPVLPAESPSRRAGGWWLFSVSVLLWGLIWWVFVGYGGPGVLLGTILLALAWLILHPREDHQETAWMIFWCAVAVLAGTAAVRGLQGSVREPFALFDGVSVWPAVVLRSLAAGLALLFCRLAWRDMRHLRDDLTQRFFLERQDGFGPPIRCQGEMPDGAPNELQLVARDFPKRGELNQGSNPDAATGGASKGNEKAEWLEYLAHTDPFAANNQQRATRWVVASLLLAGGAMALIGFPSANVRGSVAETGDSLSLTAALLALSVLCVFVGDQLWQCRKFMARLWARTTTAYGLELEETLTLSARLSGGVGELLLYPFAVCFILLCAHATYFEQWRNLPGLYAALGVALAALVILTWQMQRTARDLRTRTLRYLQFHVAEAAWIKRLVLQQVPADGTDGQDARKWWRYTLERLGRHQNPPEVPRILALLDAWPKVDAETSKKSFDDYLKPAREADITFQNARISRLDQLVKIVSEIREGAFGGWHANPIFRSLLIPGAGLGSLQLIQRLMLG